MAIMCNLCSDPLKNSKYYEVICRDATEHEEIRKKKVDDLQENSNEEDKEKKDESRKAKEREKLIQAYRAELEDMDKDEVDDLLESLRAKIHELRKKLNPETDEDKQSKEASLEFIGVDACHLVGKDGDNAINELQTLQIHRKKKLKHSQSYSVLTLDQGHNTASGDSLLQRMGSVD